MGSAVRLFFLRSFILISEAKLKNVITKASIHAVENGSPGKKDEKQAVSAYTTKNYRGMTFSPPLPQIKLLNHNPWSGQILGLHHK